MNFPSIYIGFRVMSDLIESKSPEFVSYLERIIPARIRDLERMETGVTDKYN
jgi:hypothetical protein